MVDLEKLAQVSEGAELPPTIREAVRAILDAPVLTVEAPPEPFTSRVRPAVYAFVEVRA